MQLLKNGKSNDSAVPPIGKKLVTANCKSLILEVFAFPETADAEALESIASAIHKAIRSRCLHDRLAYTLPFTYNLTVIF